MPRSAIGLVILAFVSAAGQLAARNSSSAPRPQPAWTAPAPRPPANPPLSLPAGLTAASGAPGEMLVLHRRPSRRSRLAASAGAPSTVCAARN